MRPLFTKTILDESRPHDFNLSHSMKPLKWFLIEL